MTGRHENFSTNKHSRLGKLDSSTASHDTHSLSHNELHSKVHYLSGFSCRCLLNASAESKIIPHLHSIRPTPSPCPTARPAALSCFVKSNVITSADKCPKGTLLNGPFGGDDKAFDRLLGPSGILTRTSLVVASADRVTHYSRTDAGKVYQKFSICRSTF